jgi:hypothetical protein
MLEAINDNRSGCFGWAVVKLVEDGRNQWKFYGSKDSCQHHHQNKLNLVGKSAHVGEGISEDDRRNNASKDGSRDWVWYPSWKELTGHYVYELGFLACVFQLFGASVFWISGFTALPGIYNNLSWPAQEGVYLAPQIIGGSGFVISGVLFCLETQAAFYEPAPYVLGWWIGIGNLIGGLGELFTFSGIKEGIRANLLLGFTLCPIFGFWASEDWAAYQEALSTFWGSWAFLIASLLQQYESLQKFPVSVKKEKDVAEKK